MKCSFENCEGTRWARGWCNKHYTRWRLHGSPDVNLRSVPEKCTLESCDSPYHAVGFCKKHYKEQYYDRNKNRLLAEQKAYREQLPEGVLKLRKQVDYLKNKDRYLALSRKWALENPDARAAAVSRYSAKRRGLLREGFLVSQRALSRLLVIYRGKCAHCGVALTDDYHWDHVVPLSRGGSHGEGNLVPSCPPCNLSKNSRTVTQWRKAQRLAIL